MNPSKASKAYYRKLWIALLIDSERHSLLSLEEATGMHRRTLQTAMAGFSDIGIECEFVQDGPKHKHGYYCITDWGDHRRDWIETRRDDIEALLRDQ